MKTKEELLQDNLALIDLLNEAVDLIVLLAALAGSRYNEATPWADFVNRAKKKLN